MLHQALDYAHESAELQSLATLLQRISRSEQWWEARAAAVPDILLPSGQAPSVAELSEGRLVPESLTGVGGREEHLAARILAAVRHPGDI